jgi:hypothetical protein
MGNTSPNSTASNSKNPEVNSQQTSQIYEQTLHLLSSVIKRKQIEA